MKQCESLAIIVIVIIMISIFNKYDTFEEYTEPIGTTTTYTTTTSSTTTNRGPTNTEIALLVFFSISVVVLLLFGAIMIGASNSLLTPRTADPDIMAIDRKIRSSKHSKKKAVKV
jgi:hypothetical protein